MALLPGTRAGHYEIIGPLGAGGMAEVYRARDTRLEREVALKVLPEEFASDPGRVLRFEREARAISLLNHPNILAVFDVGSHQGRPYLVTELLEGETLYQRLRHGPLPQRKAIDFAQQIARGLAAAHEKGVVHRDLKPENLFASRDGILKILDFGLARIAPEVEAAKFPQRGPATQFGATVGTVGYMSPEQVRGEPADHRSDIFSFGAVLYELLSGTPAFSAPTGAESMVKILKEEPPPIPLPPALDQVLRHCLEKNPDDRFYSARDLGFALQAFSSSDVSGARPPSPTGSRSAKIHFRLLTAAPALLLAALALLAGHFLWSPPPARLPVYRQVTFGRGDVNYARFAAAGQAIFFSANWEGRPVAVFSVRPEYPQSRQVSPPNTILLSVTPSGELGILRNARYLHHLQWRGTLASMPVEGGAPRDLLDDVEDADWDPTATSPQRIAVVRRNEANGKTRLEFPIGKVVYETSGWISHIRVSPRGGLVAFLDHPVLNDSLGSVMVVDASGNVRTLSTGWAAEVGLAWAPGGKEVWFSATRAGSTLSIFAVTLDGLLREALNSPGRLLLQDINSDGRLLLAPESLRSLLVATVPGQKEDRDLSWLDHSFRPHISSDGDFLLFTEGASAAGPHYAVCLRKTDGSPVVRLGEGTGLGLSPDGLWALAVVPASPGQLLLLPTGAGQSITLDRGQIEAYGFGSWLPDGKSILFTASEPGQPPRAYLQQVPAGSPKRALRIGLLPVPETISPDGRSVVCRTESGTFLLCPLNGGEPRPLVGLLANEQPVGWTPDGLTLYVADLSDLPLAVCKLDPVTGKREHWRDIAPADTTGLINASGFTITRDGRAYAATYVRILNELYTVEGVK
ncbi:MAG TPA: protein kinase [Candidatus Acidoferrales bacterium]|nr:protein kinase [Candidatus Acidoferrales bacterium]